jgi:hypothetical protein
MPLRRLDLEVHNLFPSSCSASVLKHTITATNSRTWQRSYFTPPPPLFPRGAKVRWNNAHAERLWRIVWSSFNDARSTVHSFVSFSDCDPCEYDLVWCVYEIVVSLTHLILQIVRDACRNACMLIFIKSVRYCCEFLSEVWICQQILV